MDSLPLCSWTGPWRIPGQASCQEIWYEMDWDGGLDNRQPSSALLGLVLTGFCGGHGRHGRNSLWNMSWYQLHSGHTANQWMGSKVGRCLNGHGFQLRHNAVCLAESDHNGIRQPEQSEGGRHRRAKDVFFSATDFSPSSRSCDNHSRHVVWVTVYVSAGQIILTPAQPVGSGRPQRESNPEPPHKGSRALPTELPRPGEGGGREERETRERGRERLVEREEGERR